MSKISLIFLVLFSLLSADNDFKYNKNMRNLSLDNDPIFQKLIYDNNGVIIEFADNSSEKFEHKKDFINQVILIGERHDNNIRRKIVPIVDYIFEKYPVYAIGMEGELFGKVKVVEKKIVINKYVNELNKHLQNSSKIDPDKSYKELNRILCNQYSNGILYSYLIKLDLECDGENVYKKYYDNNLVFGLENNDTIIQDDLNNQLIYDTYFYQLFIDFKNIEKKHFMDYGLNNIDDFLNYLSNIEITLNETYQKSMFLPLVNISVLELLILRYDFKFYEINKIFKFFIKNKNMFPMSSKIKLDDKRYEDFKKIAFQKKLIYDEIISNQIVLHRRNFDFYNSIKSYIKRIKPRKINGFLTHNKHISKIKNIDNLNRTTFYKDKKIVISIVGCKHMEGVYNLLVEDNISVISIDFASCF